MSAVFLKSAFHNADLPKNDRPHIAMLGRSNVGKSSLINHLAGVKNLAYTSQTPGLTRAINLYDFDGRYFLVDLPGYGFHVAARSRGRGFEDMIGEYLSDARMLKLVLLIVDGRRTLAESDRYALEQLQEQKLPFIIIANKMDKLSASAATVALRKLRKEFPGVTFLPHAVSDNKSLGEIRDVIEKMVRSEASK